ncbi:hypothetical protein FSP39_014831 [Pinctada imbricata]|uniref:Neurotransmitter-gated ion-channel ligand-binding domain-containing protein n=1 Tax=Pinctada imbricata TaxID=66713 RepID=A0AA89C5W0_PINIB|nr:hypothetical protein FSP39_014831 [Pinctada imbricata]
MRGVNTMKEQFTAEIYVRAKWREPALDKENTNEQKGKKQDLSEYWNPNLSIQNLVSSTSDTMRRNVWKNSTGEAFIQEQREINGTFSEQLELHNFPFDFQDLTIAISSTLPQSELDIMEDDNSISELGIKCFLFKQEFNYQNFVDLIPRVITREYMEGAVKGESYPALNVKIVAVRKYAFFVWNIILLMTLISSFPITTFAISMNNPQRRLLLGFILALTGVSFRFMANQNIPKIPYQTILDKYLLVSMLYNYVVAIWHVVVSRFDHVGDEQRDMDWSAFIASIVLYLIIQLVFTVIVLMTRIFLKVVFLKLSDIDTVKEQFSAEIFVQARWRELSLDHGKDKDKPDLRTYWEPKLIIQNVVSTTRNNTWKDLRYGKSGEAFIVEKRRIKGVFNENLELQEFPFDFQDLGVVITSERPVDEVEIVEDDQDLSSLTVSCFVDEQEWDLRDFIESENKSVTKDFSEGKNVAYPFLLMKTLARRRPAFFVWNIIIIMTIISSLSFATFAVNNNLPQNRLQLAFTLTLTGVTFRFVTNQQLPKIPYLTKLYIRKRNQVKQKELDYQAKAIKLMGETWQSRSRTRKKRAVGPQALPF